MAKIWDEMKKQKDELVKAVGGIGKKQDDLSEQQSNMMTKQDQMDDRLKRVRSSSCSSPSSCLSACLPASSLPVFSSFTQSL